MPGVADVRCLGAIGVIQVTELHDLNWLRARFVEHDVWLRPFGDMIYLTPPLTISAEQLAQLTTATVRVVSEWARRG